MIPEPQVVIDDDAGADPADFANAVIVGVDNSEGAATALAWAQAHTRSIGPLIAIRFDNHHLPAGHRAAGHRLVEISQEARLLVVGSRGRGAIAGALLGSTSSYCAHHAAVPVVIVPEAVDLDDGIDRLVVGVDGSDNGLEALRWALRFGPADAAVDAHFSWATDHVAKSLTEEERARVRASGASFLGAAIARVVAEEGGEERTIEPHLSVGEPALALRAGGGSVIVVGSPRDDGFSPVGRASQADALISHPRSVTVLVRS